MLLALTGLAVLSLVFFAVSAAGPWRYPAGFLASHIPAGLPPPLELPPPSDPLQGHLTLHVTRGGRGRLLVQGRYVAAVGEGRLTVPVQEGDLIEVDARTSAVLTVASVSLSGQLVLLPDCLPVQAGGRLATLGWVRGPLWPGAAPGGR